MLREELEQRCTRRVGTFREKDVSGFLDFNIRRVWDRLMNHRRVCCRDKLIVAPRHDERWNIQGRQSFISV